MKPLVPPREFPAMSRARAAAMKAGPVKAPPREPRRRLPVRRQVPLELVARRKPVAKLPLVLLEG